MRPSMNYHQKIMVIYKFKYGLYGAFISTTPHSVTISLTHFPYNYQLATNTRIFHV